jgi:hypothetical protein
LPTIDVEYNGRRLDPSKSCHLEGIPNNAYLDAVVSGTSAGGKTINLEFRVNGDSKDMHSVNVSHSGSFESAMIAFAERRNCSLTDCKFIFDGELLQRTTTVESLDLEGGEIIDVKITASAVEAPPLQDDDGDVIMTETAAAVISVKTCRNVSPFLLSDFGSLLPTLMIFSSRFISLSSLKQNRRRGSYPIPTLFPS